MNPERRAEWGYREKVHVETVPTNPSFSVVLGTNPRASHVDGQGSLHSYVMSGLPFLFSGSPLVLLGTTQSRSILTGLGGGAGGVGEANPEGLLQAMQVLHPASILYPPQLPALLDTPLICAPGLKTGSSSQAEPAVS